MSGLPQLCVRVTRLSSRVAWIGFYDTNVFPHHGSISDISNRRRIASEAEAFNGDNPSSPVFLEGIA